MYFYIYSFAFNLFFFIKQNIFCKNLTEMLKEILNKNLSFLFKATVYKEKICT